MPSKRPKAEVSAKAALRLPRLPDELWGKIFHDVAQRYDADLAALRLVNNYCAQVHASRQYARIVRRMFRRKRQWHLEELALKTHSIQGTVDAVQAEQERDQLRSRYAGEVASEQRMERFIWMFARSSLGHTALIPFLKRCIDTLRALGY